MKNKKLVLVIIAILLLVNLGLVWYILCCNDRQPGRDADSRRKYMKERLKKETGLNDAQVARFDSMHNQHRERMKPLFEEMTAAKKELFDKISNNDTAYQPLLNRIAAMQQKIDLEMLLHFKTLRQIATPEQQAGMDSVIHKMINRMIMPGFGKKNNTK